MQVQFLPGVFSILLVCVLAWERAHRDIDGLILRSFVHCVSQPLSREADDGHSQPLSWEGRVVSQPLSREGSAKMRAERFELPTF
jgi:hypothetical protein